MKFFTILAFFFLITAGCTPYWYNPEKNLDQAIEDCRDCDSHKDYLVFVDCMKQKEYTKVDELALPPGVKREMIPRRSRFLGLPLNNPDLIRLAGH